MKKIILTENQYNFLLKENETSSDYQNKLNQFTSGEPDFKFYYYDEHYESKVELCKIVYIRFGLPRKDENGDWITSQRYHNNEVALTESGISVYEVGWNGENIIYESKNASLNSSISEIMNTSRTVYVVDGELNSDDGTDGEPLIIPNTFKVITEIPKEIILGVN
jgi:hypothetical protein